MRWRIRFKVIAVLFIVCMLFEQISFSSSQTITAQEANSVSESFQDIKGHWCQPVIEKFTEKGWVKGYNDGLFRPEKLINRAEFTVMVIRILNKPDINAECKFSDIKRSDWFYRDVASSVGEKYIEGYPEGTFKPFAEMSRQEVAVFVQRLLKVDPYKGETSIRFIDESAFPEWSAFSIKALASHEIIKGYTDGSFKPDKLTTRAEAVKMLDVVLKKLNIVEEPKATSIPAAIPTSTYTAPPTATPTPTLFQLASQSGNYSYQPVPTSTPIHIVDLIPAKVDASDTAFITETCEVTGSVTVEVYNEGTENNINRFEVLLFEDINNDSMFGNGDTVLGRGIHNGELKAQQSIQLKINVKGKVRFRDNIIYAWVDSGNRIVETNENNNIKHSRFDCKDKPPVGSFSPVLEWRWAGSANTPDSVNVMMTPVVMDINNDGIPEVIFGSTSSTSGQYVEVGELRAIRGDTGEEVFSVTDSVYKINTASSIAAGDIDNDKLPEIVACDATGNRLIVFENDGTFKWRSPDLDKINWGSPSLADIDGNGSVEIIIGRQVLDNKGNILWTGARNGNPDENGPLSFAADIDGDGLQEVICGNTIYDYKGNIYSQNKTLLDGRNALANFDDDEYPEIVLVQGGNVWLLENDMSIKWGPVGIPGGGRGGPPTVADFDSDGKVEIGVAGANKYVVFDTDGRELWKADTQDISSNLTGSSVFDFDGDGSYEVVYRDELYLRIYNGKNGDVLFQEPMSSCTWYEYVLVADVDNDSNAEIVAVANNNCGCGNQRGVYVYGDANDTWVNTRRVWNQHAYSITNINDDGTIPKKPVQNWKLYNNFRCNQSADALACVDLSSSYLNSVLDSSKNIELSVRVGNCGSLPVAKGVKVSFYDGKPGEGGVLLGTIITEKSIVPGEFLDIKLAAQTLSEGRHTIYAVVDDDGTGHGMVREIREDNNLANIEFDFSGSGIQLPEPGSGSPEIPQPAAIVKSIEPSEAYSLLNSNKDIVIIDVRSSSEFSGGHISGAINIEYNAGTFVSNIEKLDKKGKYLVCCKSGNRSSAGIDIMKQSGFTELYNLVGGITAWKENGYPVLSN